MEDFSQTLYLYVHFGAVSLIHSAPQRNAATLRKVLAPFLVSHVIAIDSCSLLSRSFSPFFSLFLDFIAISDCFFNNKNHYVLGHTGYQIIITILVISTLNANLRVATRVYDVEGDAIFSKNSTFVFFDGAAWTPRLRSPSPIMAPGYAPWCHPPPPPNKLCSSCCAVFPLFTHKMQWGLGMRQISNALTFRECSMVTQISDNCFATMIEVPQSKICLLETTRLLKVHVSECNF